MGTLMRSSSTLRRYLEIAVVVSKGDDVYSQNAPRECPMSTPQNELSAGPQANTFSPQHGQEALAYCEEEINFYSCTGTYNHRRWKYLLMATIVLGAAATVLASIQPRAEYITPFLIARTLSVAATTIAASLNSSFSFQKESVRQWATSDLLQGERIKFKTQSKPYDNEVTSVNEFINRIREIISAENRTWISTSQSTESKAG